MLPGVTTKIERDASGGRSMVVIEHKEDLNPQIIVKGSKGEALATYSVPTGAQVAVDEGKELMLAQSLPNSKTSLQNTGYYRRFAKSCGII